MNTTTAPVKLNMPSIERSGSRFAKYFSSPEKAISLGILLGGIALWQFITAFFDVPSIIVPSPLEVLRWLVRGFSEPYSSPASYWPHLVVTLVESLIGFIGGVVVGVLCGFGLAHWPTAERVFYPYIQAFNALPKIAIAPLMVVWLGFGYLQRLAVFSDSSRLWDASLGAEFNPIAIRLTPWAPSQEAPKTVPFC